MSPDHVRSSRKSIFGNQHCRLPKNSICCVGDLYSNRPGGFQTNMCIAITAYNVNINQKLGKYPLRLYFQKDWVLKTAVLCISFWLQFFSKYVTEKDQNILELDVENEDRNKTKKKRIELRQF